MKKTFAALLAVLLTMLLPMTALAEPKAGDTFEIPEGYLMISLPEGYVYADRSLDETYAFSRKLGLDASAAQSQAEALENYSMYLEAYDEDALFEMTVLVQTPEQAGLSDETAFDYTELDEDSLLGLKEAFETEATSSDGTEITYSSVAFTTVNGVRWMNADASMENGGTVYHKIQSSTCKNGMVITLTLFPVEDGAEITDEMRTALSEFLGGVTVGVREGYTAPVPATASATSDEAAASDTASAEDEDVTTDTAPTEDETVSDDSALTVEESEQQGTLVPVWLRAVIGGVLGAGIAYLAVRYAQHRNSTEKAKRESRKDCFPKL